MLRKIFQIVVLFFMLNPCYADTINWTGAAGDNLWLTPGNWSAGRIPDKTDNFYITGVHTVNVEPEDSEVNPYPPDIQVGWYDTATSTYMPREFILAGGATLNSQHGFLYTTSGKIEVDNANLNVSELHVGESGRGELTFSSGKMNVPYNFVIANIGGRVYELPPKPDSILFDLIEPDPADMVPGRYAYGVLTQTGGTLETGNMIFSNTQYLLPTGTPEMNTGAEYNLFGGTLIAGSISGGQSLSLEKIDPENPMSPSIAPVPGETNIRWNISGNSQVIVRGSYYPGWINLASWDSQDGNAEMNIYNGNIQVQGEFTATRNKSRGEQYVRIFGDTSRINVGEYNTHVIPLEDGRHVYNGNLDSHFYLTSHGVSSIDAATYASVDQDHTVGVWGFAALTEKRYDLIRANEIVDPATWSIDDQTGVGFKAATDDANGWHNAYIYIDEADPPANLDTWVWDRDDSRYDIEDEMLWQQGALKVDGWRWEAVTMYLDPDSLSDGLAQRLVDFLNERQDGLQYILLEDQTSIGLLGHLLDGNGAGYFAWDLSWFNDLDNTSVGIIAYDIGYFHTPEPATWGMLLLGGAMIFVVRRKHCPKGV